MSCSVRSASGGRSDCWIQGRPDTASVLWVDFVACSMVVVPPAAQLASPRASARASRAKASGPPVRRVRVLIASEAEGLGAALDLGAAVLPQRVDGAAGEVAGSEDPRDALAVVPPEVVQHRQQSGQALDDLAVLDELGRDLLPGSGAGYG